MAGAAPRIVEARNRAEIAKRAIAAVSVAGFLSVLVLAKAAHPGHSAASQPATSNGAPTSRSSEDDGGGFGFGSGSIAPSQNVVPSVQTNTS